jgi:hypothetical protein
VVADWGSLFVVWWGRWKKGELFTAVCAEDVEPRRVVF